MSSKIDVDKLVCLSDTDLYPLNFEVGAIQDAQNEVNRRIKVLQQATERLQGELVKREYSKILEGARAKYNIHSDKFSYDNLYDMRSVERQTYANKEILMKEHSPSSFYSLAWVAYYARSKSMAMTAVMDDYILEIETPRIAAMTNDELKAAYVRPTPDNSTRLHQLLNSRVRLKPLQIRLNCLIEEELKRRNVSFTLPSSSNWDNL